MKKTLNFLTQEARSELKDLKNLVGSSIQKNAKLIGFENLKDIQTNFKFLGDSGCAFFTAIAYHDIKYGTQLTNNILGISFVAKQLHIIDDEYTVLNWHQLWTYLCCVSGEYGDKRWEEICDLHHYKEISINDQPPELCAEVWSTNPHNMHFVLRYQDKIIDFLNGHSINVANGELVRRFIFE